MKRSFGRAVAVLGLLVLSCRNRGTEPAESVVLAPGAVFPRALTGRGPYRFRFEMPAGRFLRLDVEQHGVDVVVALDDPEDRRLYEIDSPTGRYSPEPVLVVTPVSGRYRLMVEPLHEGAKGHFSLRVRALRPAGERDRICAGAASAFTRAEKSPPTSDFERTAATYRGMLPALTACGEPSWQARAEEHLGEALLEAGELREAAPLLESAAARLQSLGDGAWESRALNQAGAAWRKLGEPGRALGAYQRALQLSRAAGESAREASALNNIGLVYKNTGDLQGAIVQYETALGLWRRLGIRSSEAVTLQNLGSLYSLIGHDDEALDLLQKAQSQLAAEKDPAPRISVLIALGWAQYLAGRPDAALDRYQEALTLAESTGNRQILPGLLDRRGTALRALHRYGEAAASYTRALAMIRPAGNRIGEGSTLANLGWLDLETNAPERARPRLQRARELLAASGDPNGEAYALTGLSRAERRLGDLDAAREHLETALRLVETVRTRLWGSMSRGFFLAYRFNAYEDLVSLLMELDRRQPAAGHAREALEVAERARARNLVEEIAAGPGAESDPGPQRKRDLLLAEIEALEERRRTIAAQDPHDPLLHDLDASLRSRFLEIDRLAPPPAQQPAFASLRQIQALADADTLLVVYLLAEPASFAWTIDRETVAVHLLPGRERIEQLARRVVAAQPLSQEHATQETTARVVHELSEAVLDPLGKRLAGRRRLVILPDGALSLVSFSALRAPAERAGEPAEPLLLDHEIVMLPSATALLAQRRRLAGRRPAPGTVAILADPVFSATDERLARGSGVRSVPDGQVAEGIDVSLHRLPYTAEEAQAIARLVPPEERLLALGTAADRDLVLSGALRRYRILHFATHGLLDPVLPERSGVVLSLVDGQGRRREGFLSAPDVAGLDLPAELAVLSACQTALGREVRGEGVVGLTQAFFRAGVRGVVVGYWSVDDRATSVLMAAFYRHLLQDGMPPAAALRAAQLAVRGEERWKAPYYWAGFSFHGDWQQAAANKPHGFRVSESRGGSLPAKGRRSGPGQSEVK
ncbi:MAG: CHAT domain-containing protein [Thermoanaerobaculia bacterium]